MKKGIVIGILISICFSFGYHQFAKSNEKSNVKLGAFSISLGLKNLEVSKQFYQKIGFKMFADHSKNNYCILKNGNALIGLFQGMFNGNMLTFNPGWDENAKEMKKYNDIREIQTLMLKNNLNLDSKVEENTKGPASLVLTDPDGNVILFDQHL